MPYIVQKRREGLDEKIKVIVDTIQERQLFGFVHDFLVKSLRLDTGPRYKNIMKAMGTLDCVRRELSFRFLSKENGRQVAMTGDLVESPPEETDRLVDEVWDRQDVEGDLNYCISAVLTRRLKLWKQEINVSSFLDRVSKYIYDTIAVPYELSKKTQNGDFFDLD